MKLSQVMQFVLATVCLLPLACSSGGVYSESNVQARSASPTPAPAAVTTPVPYLSVAGRWMYLDAGGNSWIMHVTDDGTHITGAIPNGVQLANGQTSPLQFALTGLREAPGSNLIKTSNSQGAPGGCQTTFYATWNVIKNGSQIVISIYRSDAACGVNSDFTMIYRINKLD